MKKSSSVICNPSSANSSSTSTSLVSSMNNQKRLVFQLALDFIWSTAQKVWFLLFEPECKAGGRGTLGYSSKLLALDVDDEDKDAAEAERDREVAEIFDKMLVDEVSRIGTICVLTSNKLAGWDAFTLESGLEQAQLASSMMSLPADHPAREEYLKGFFASLRGFNR